MAKDAAYRKAQREIAAAHRDGFTGIRLTSMQLTELPESLSEFSRFRKLSLSRNKLTALPPWLGQLSQLVELRLDHNQLTSLPESLGQLSQLRRLDLKNNQLTALPDSLCQLSHLKGLVLDNNQLTALPELLGQLSQLLELHLDNNQLTALPESLGQLSHLELLILYNNQLAALPESLGQLSQLRELYVSNNQLTTLPESLGQLSQLRLLYLDGNPALGIPGEVLASRNPSKILDYYFRTRIPEGRRPLNEAKLILVGRGGVGKTSLVNRLVRDTFDPNENKTEGIYRLLNASKLADQQGELRLADVAAILKGDDYPPEMHRFLLDLMKKFELCFTYPTRDESHYLVPELLSKQEPPEAAEFQPAECLNFQYHYPVIPEGLLPRFIVRTHVLSDGLPQWRTGVILEFDGNQALVKADPAEKKVFISVDGPTAGRRRLLAVIRADFETIHRDIPRLNPQEMVPVPGHPQTLVSYRELLLREEKDRLEFEVIVGDEIVPVNVLELLGEVDLGPRHGRGQLEAHELRKIGLDVETLIGRDAVRLFYSYSHKDDHLRNELQTHLKLLERQGKIAGWHDRLITAGQEWKGEIDRELEAADVILLLVSPDFIASDYCYDVEMQQALERRAAGEAEVITVILRPTHGWQQAGIGPADERGRTELKLGDLQVLPKDAKPIVEWGKERRDAAWSHVAAAIERAAERIRAVR